MKKKLLDRKILLIVILTLVSLPAMSDWQANSRLEPLWPGATAKARTRQLSDPVETEQGLVRGEQRGETIAFLGIPYASPPVGQLRWRPPQGHAPWEGVLDRLEFGSSCPQFDTFRDDKIIGEEDCLTLNIWMPSEAEPTPRPVMVFIHGGGNVQGSSSIPLYDGQALVEKGGVVVVTINYRLGQLGFLAHPLLSAEDVEHNSSGNYALLDQILALQWVNRNIQNFGGDADNITIFGESAGGINVSSLVASPLASGLFQRAIVESGGFIINTRLRDAAGAPAAESAEEFGVRFAEESGCDSAGDILGCMRGLSIQEVLNTLKSGDLLLSNFEGGVSYGPNLDGFVLPDSPLTAMLTGQHNDVPIIIGTNKNEGSAFILGIELDSEADYRAAVERFFPDFSDAVLARYPVADFDSPRQAFDAIITDLAFICPARAASLALESQSSPRFVYHFTHTVDAPFLRRLGAFHGLELLFVFDNFDPLRPNQEEQGLSDIMLAYWTTFAKTGDPNGPALPLWPAFGVEGDAHLNLDTPITSGTALRKEFCDFWFDLFSDVVGSAR